MNIDFEYKRRFRIGEELQRSGTLLEAESIYRELMQEAPTVGVLSNLGILLRTTDRLEEAVQLLARAARAAPHNTTHLYNLANAYSDLGQSEKSELLLRRVLEIDPDHKLARLNLGHALLRHGNYLEGWKFYEQRIGLPDQGNSIPPSRFPIWTGEPLVGKSILVVLEQGLGDQIMFSRFCRQLKKMGARQVTLTCSPTLAPILSQVADDVIPTNGDTEISNHDFWIYAGSLPGRLGITVDTLDPAPYLQTPLEYSKKWDGKFPDKFNVGIVSRGNPKHQHDKYRSIFDDYIFEKLTSLPINVINLQIPQGNFADTAGILENLKILISVDTSIVHLAGALGKPCWMMCSTAGVDWRWMKSRSESPWYSSIKIYRQNTRNNWKELIDRISADLQILMGNN